MKPKNKEYKHYQLKVKLPNGEIWQDYTLAFTRDAAIVAFLSALPLNLGWEVVRAHTKIFDMKNYKEDIKIGES